MALKKGSNKAGKEWTKNDENELRKLARGNVPTRLIAYTLGRTEYAVRTKASNLDVSLKPTNKPPYNRGKKG